MKVLGFKKWYEGKSEKNAYSVSSGNGFSKIGENIFRFPQKMLQIEMDILTETVDIKKSKNRIDRYFMSANPDLYKQEQIKSIKRIVEEGNLRGNKFFLVGYDLTSVDPKKCYKNSIKLVETFKKSFDFLESISTRGMGRIEPVHENYFSKIPSRMIKQRIELIECHFDPEKTETKIDLPFHFNPNDYSLLEKYQICLRGILFQNILKNESFALEVNASKPWTSSKKEELNEKNKPKEDQSILTEMEYPNPGKSSLLYPQNKPVQTNSKITVKELTEKRALSIVEYLSKISLGMPIEYSHKGIGYKEGNPSLNLVFKNLEP
jgi:hypothetical protein